MYKLVNVYLTFEWLPTILLLNFILKIFYQQQLYDDIRIYNISFIVVAMNSGDQYEIIGLHTISHFIKIMWPDLTKAGLDAHIKQIYFPLPIDKPIYGLTIDGYFTVHSFSVCFSCGWFLWSVWCPRVHGCSSIGPGASWQVAKWLKMWYWFQESIWQHFEGITVENDLRRGLLGRLCNQ